MECAYKFRLYPTPEQEEKILQNFGCCRFVYNYFLDYRKTVYEKEKRTAGYNECSGLLPQLKAANEWLREADSTALQSALRSLDTAFAGFFRRVKKKGRPYGYPSFKSKRSAHQSYTCKRVGDNIRMADDSHIRLPKIGIVSCVISRAVEGRILNATVSRSAAGKYYVSLCCTDVEKPALPKTGVKAGVDLGIKALAVTDAGTVYPNHRYAGEAGKKLVRLERSLSRKTKGSKNREKARKKLARQHEKVANQRKDAMQKLTTQLIREYDIICLEDLATKPMMGKSRLSAKGFADTAPSEFRRQLEYKAKWYRKTVIAVDRLYPSSQLCSACGAKNPALKDLRIRSWVCPVCGAEHDRDQNAAQNILREGLRILSS